MHPRLTDFVNDRLVAEAPADERAIADNFRMEERLPKEVQGSYGSYFSDTPLSSLDDWRGFHKDFLDEQVNLTTDAEYPWTFRGGNIRNLKPQDPITILRIESLDGAIGVSGATLSATEIEQYVRELHTGTRTSSAPPREYSGASSTPGTGNVIADHSSQPTVLMSPRPAASPYPCSSWSIL